MDRHGLAFNLGRRLRELEDLVHHLILDLAVLLHVHVRDLAVFDEIEGRDMATEARRRHGVEAAQQTVRLVDVDVALDVERHLVGDAIWLGRHQQADRDVLGLEHLGETDRAGAAHRVADQHDQRRVKAIVGDRVLGDLRTHDGLVDRRLESGLLDAVGEIVRPAREDHAGKAAKQIGARFHRGAGIAGRSLIRRAPREPAR